MPVESFATAQFRHGPLELAGPGLAAIVIATEPDTRALDVDLARDLVGAGAAVLLITDEEAGVEGALRVTIGSVAPQLAPAVSIIPAQLLAWRLAVLRGREPGTFLRSAKVTTDE